jgi:hypothetical protein
MFTLWNLSSFKEYYKIYYKNSNQNNCNWDRVSKIGKNIKI